MGLQRSRATVFVGRSERKRLKRAVSLGRKERQLKHVRHREKKRQRLTVRKRERCIDGAQDVCVETELDCV